MNTTKSGIQPVVSLRSASGMNNAKMSTEMIVATRAYVSFMQSFLSFIIYKRTVNFIS